MKVALGLKAHSGWAVLVVIGIEGDEIRVLDRRRIELVDKGALWAKQPYHAAEGQEPAKARKIVQAGIAMSRRCAVREIRAAVKRLNADGHRVSTCAVLVPNPMPAWITADILAVHFRMHKAEGVMFPDALLRAAKACRLRAAAVQEKHLAELAKKALGARRSAVMGRIKKLGKSVGPPWGADQKNAVLAGLIA